MKQAIICTIFCMLIIVGCADKKDAPREECQAEYQQQMDEYGTTWFQFRASGVTCFERVGSFHARCVWGQ